MVKRHMIFLFLIALALGAAPPTGGAANDATLDGDFSRIIASAKLAPVIVEDDGTAHVSVNYVDKLHFWFSSVDRFSAKCILVIDIPNSDAPYLRLIGDDDCDGAIDAVSMTSSDELQHVNEISESDYLFLQRMGAAAADSFEAMTYLDAVPTAEASTRMRENPYLMPERLRSAVAAATESSLMSEDPAEKRQTFAVNVNFSEQNVGQMLIFEVEVEPSPLSRPDCAIYRLGDGRRGEVAVNHECNTEWNFTLNDDGSPIYDQSLAKSIAMSALDSLLRFSWVANEHFALDPAQ